VFDLQILELVNRRVSHEPTKTLSALADVIGKYRLALSEWNGVEVTDNGLYRFELGLPCSMTETRPLSPRILAYCIQAVVLLPDLETAILGSIGVSSLARDAHKKFVEETSARRITDSQRKEYNPLVVMRNMTLKLSRVTFHNPGF
jgi:hypothetical protein